MNGELYQISVEEMWRLVAAAPVEIPDDGKPTMETFARLSAPLLAGMYGAELVCIVGLVPVTALSDTAYLWVQPTEAIHRHKTKFARYVRKWLRSDRIGYTTLRGHCLIEDISGQDWVKWLGAEFGAPAGPVVPFTIRRY